MFPCFAVKAAILVAPLRTPRRSEALSDIIQRQTDTDRGTKAAEDWKRSTRIQDRGSKKRSFNNKARMKICNWHTERSTIGARRVLVRIEGGRREGKRSRELKKKKRKRKKKKEIEKGKSHLLLVESDFIFQVILITNLQISNNQIILILDIHFLKFF